MDADNEIALKSVATHNSISIQDMVRNLNNANLDEQILVFESEFPYQGKYPEIFPLRCETLLLILVTEGQGRIGIDLKEYDIRKDTLIVLQPKNYFTLSLFDERCAARVVACSNKVLEDVLPRLTDILPLLLHHRTEPVVHLSREDAESMNSYYMFLRDKLSRPATAHTKEKVMCIMQAALYEMVDIQQRISDTRNIVRTRKEEIMARFLLAVSEHFREQRQVSFYADMLCITPKHLSTVVKEVSGRTAGNWIENYVVMEAKVMLRTTDLPVQEIANRLNFLNQSFFGKYFKHLTGVSPSQFRKQTEL